MLHNIQIENAFNCVLKRRFIAVGPFSRSKSHLLKFPSYVSWKFKNNFYRERERRERETRERDERERETRERERRERETRERDERERRERDTSERDERERDERERDERETRVMELRKFITYKISELCNSET